MKEIMIGTWAWGTGINGSSMIFGKRQNPEILKQAFNEAVKLGFMNWDTAAVYGMGTCEALLGTMINEHEDIFISTKFAPGKKYKKGALSKSFDESMKRLGRNNVDLFWIHVPNNLEQNLQEAISLIKGGSIKRMGISNVSLEHIKAAEKVLHKEGLKLDAVQNHFSLLRNDQQSIIDYCNNNGIKYYAYMVLEQGALSGKYSAKNPFPLFSSRNLSFPKSKFIKIQNLLDIMKNIADKYNIDSSQIPIAWAINKGVNPIIGLTSPSQAVALSDGVSVELTVDEIKRLEELALASGVKAKGVWEKN